MTKINLPAERQVGHLTLLRQGRNITLAEYNALTTDEQLNMIRHAHGKEKYDLLINAQKVEQLVPQLHPQELYLTINELGAEYSTELLMVASPEQITTMLDLDCWDGDNLSAVLTLTWLELLLTTGNEKICQLAREMEPEILTVFLKKHLLITRGLEVYDDDDAENANRLESLYDIEYASEKAAKIIGAILKVWLDFEQESYLLIMEMVRSENLSILEEEVYLTRSNRMLDLGIIPTADAQAIYSYVEPDTFKPGGKTDFQIESEGLQHPAALLACGSPHNLLAEVLAAGSDHASACELMMLANRKMSADKTDIAETVEVAAAFQSTYDTLNLALEYLAGTDPDKAEQIYNSTYLISLFQLGNSLIKKRQLLAKEISRSAIYSYLDYPELMFIDSLLQQPAILYIDADGDIPGEPVAITAIKELQLADIRLGQIAALQHFFSEEGHLPLPINSDDNDNYPSLSGFFLTAVANQLLGNGFVSSPLDISTLIQLKEHTVATPQLQESFQQDVQETMHQLAPDCDFFVEFCLDIWQQIFHSYDVADGEAELLDTLLLNDD